MRILLLIVIDCYLCIIKTPTNCKLKPFKAYILDVAFFTNVAAKPKKGRMRNPGVPKQLTGWKTYFLSFQIIFQNGGGRFARASQGDVKRTRGSLKSLPIRPKSTFGDAWGAVTYAHQFCTKLFPKLKTLASVGT